MKKLAVVLTLALLSQSVLATEWYLVETTRACQIFCVNGVSVVNGESIAELNGKTSQRRFPVADRHRPFLADVA